MGKPAQVTDGTAGHKRPGPAMRWLLRTPARLYDARLGWLLGHRFLRLTHVGRNSGRHYRTMLEVVHADRARSEYVVVVGLGERTDWYRNVLSGGAAEVAIANEHFTPVFRRLDEQEAVDVLAAYTREHRLAAPVIKPVLTWLVGWRYDDSPQARQKLARQLPLLAFRPAERPAEDGGRRSEREDS